MIHAFEYTQEITYYFLWDPESGSLFQTDYAAYLVCKDKLTAEQIKDLNALSEKEREGIKEEIKSLEKSGLINIPVRDYGHITKRRDIKALCLNICHDCNLRCEYCFASEGTYNTPRDYMSVEVGKKAIDFLISRSGGRKSLEVDYFGGEPLMNFDTVKAVVDYAEQEACKYNKEFHFTLTTNGLLLNDGVIDYLNDKMNNVVISIDGRKDVHNRVRKSINGKDSYDIILNNALKFISKRIGKYYIRGTFTALNTDFYKDVLSLNDKGFDQISIEPVVLNSEHPLAIKNEHIKPVLDSYEKLAREYIIRRKGDKWFNFFHFMLDLINGPCVQKRLTGCGAGSEYLAVSPTGDIYPCHQFVGNNDFYMGSVLDNTLNTDIQDKFIEVNVTKKAECSDCMAKYYCSGGCIANSYHYEKELSKPYQGACEMMKKRFELSLAIYAIENLI